MAVCKRALDTRWVLTWKQQSDGAPSVKARLAAKGFQGPDLAANKVLIRASQARRARRLPIAPTAALKGMGVLQLDFAVAFWKSGGIDRDVFAEAPSLDSGMGFWQLNGAVNGVNGAPFFLVN